MISIPRRFHFMNANLLRGFFYGALSAACYGLNPLFAVPLLRQGVGVESVLFFRFLVAAVSIGTLMGICRKSFAITKQELGVLLLMSLLMTASSVSLFYGYTLIPAGIASTLLFLYPIFVAIIMIAFFHEKISWQVLVAIAIAFLGVGLLCFGEPSENESALNIWGIPVVALSALTYAVYLIAVNKTRLRGMSGTKLSFYILTIGSVILFVNAELQGGIDLPPDTTAWINVFLLATIPTLVSTIAIVRSLRFVGPTTTAILGAFEPLAAVSAGVLALGEPFTGTLAAGMILIIMSVAIIVVARKN